MTEPLRNHGDHGGATAVYAVQAPQVYRASGVTGLLGTYCKGYGGCGGESFNDFFKFHH